MIDIFFAEHRLLLKLLVQHNVRFMIIGGLAVIHYGYERSTADMDIWLETSNENKECFIKALDDFGITEDGMNYVEKVDFTQPFPVFHFGKIPRKVDFISLVQHLKFAEAYPEANHFSLDGIPIPIIHYHHLILTKLSTGRAQDKADIEELERIKKYRKGL